MNIDPLAILGALAVIAAVAGGLAYGYVHFRSSLTRTTSQLWEDEATALRTRLETVERAEAECKHRLALVEQAHSVFVSKLTGEQAILQLSGQITLLHEEIMRELAVVASALGRRQS